MGVFDDIGKTFSKAGEKTKQMTDIARINSLINDEEKKLTNIYTQIGKTYVEKNPSICQDDLTDYVDTAFDISKRIAEYKLQIQAIKGVVTCPSCGMEVSEGTKFCPSCGTPIPVIEKPVEPKPEEPKCPSCGAPITPGQKFCTECGAKLEAAAPAEDVVVDAVEKEASQEASATPTADDTAKSE